MSLDGFYGGLAALTSDPDLVRRCRAGDHDWLGAFDVTALERDRLQQMAKDHGMAVLCSLYRSNRLAALLRTVPAVVDALADRRRDDLSEFWRSIPHPDMQFRNEAVAFCGFVRARYPSDAELAAIVTSAEQTLFFNYEKKGDRNG